MLQEVKQLLWDIAVAEEEYDNNDAHDASAIYHRSRLAAWDKLKNSKNPLVAWMGAHDAIRDSYTHEAMEILKALPATVPQLDHVANNARWCSVWNDLRQEALKDGVVQLNYKYEWRENAGRWHDFRETISPGRRTVIRKTDFENLFFSGVESITMSTHGHYYTIRLKTT